MHTDKVYIYVTEMSPHCRAVEVAVACYANGALLMGEAAGQDGRGKLIMTARDLSMPPVGTATGNWGGGSSLCETVAELGLAIPGGSTSQTHTSPEVLA